VLFTRGETQGRSILLLEVAIRIRSDDVPASRVRKSTRGEGKSDQGISSGRRLDQRSLFFRPCVPSAASALSYLSVLGALSVPEQSEERCFLHALRSHYFPLRSDLDRSRRPFRCDARDACHAIYPERLRLQKKAEQSSSARQEE